MARKRNPELITNVHFTGLADKGQSVGRDAEGRVVFAEGPVPGDEADVLAIKKKKGFLIGVPQHYHRFSEHRTEPFCQHYDTCGGCQWQHLDYAAQAQHKEQVVRNALQRIGKVEVGTFYPILAATQTEYYRNKLEFTFSNKRWLLPEELNNPDITNEENVLGFHRPGAFNKIVDIQHCWLQRDPSNQLRLGIKQLGIEEGLPFYDTDKESGLLRHIIIRTTSTGEVMVILSFFKNEAETVQAFLGKVLERFPEITTLIYCINSKKNDYLYDLDMNTFSGKGYVEEKLGSVRFRVGPKSFFQTNTEQAKVLYDVVKDFAGLDGSQNVYDLYTGVGSIALYLAESCKQVVGVEEIALAIEDAKVNAAINDIENCVFYAGDVKDILSPEFAATHGAPDLVITDPPRSGMHPKVVEFFLELEAPRIVYVSCNPATQARDLQLLGEKYTVEKVQPVDMFPHTHHIENVALLIRK
ncbi:MAG: 23S rRNA (uracil(1939)-C(5))-methyltransferase RlmD [Phaeodactylibacter sp.]|nr:23S rRNA (uracil(1939)-C(5))-methyltransferase RlmD [Phaeodactylibacter sp.]